MRVENGVLIKVTDEDINPDGSFTFPRGVTSIGDDAFEYCSSLEQIEIPEGVTKIGSRAFQHCSNLKNIKISDGVTVIGYGAFIYCTSLKRVKIPEGVTKFYGFTFGNCTSLEQVEIPEGVTYIGNGAFKGCISLASIKIPNIGCCIGDGFTYVTKMSDGHFFFSKERLDEHSIVLSLDGAAAFYYFYHGDSMNANYNYDDMRYQYEDEYGYIGYDGYYDDYGNICFGMAPEWPKYGYIPSQYIGLKYSQSEITRELVNDFIKGTLSIRNSGITYSRNYNSSNMDMFLYRMMRLIGAEEIEKMLKVNEISEEDLRTYFDSQSQIYEKYTQKKFGVGGIDGLTIGIVKGLDKRLGTLKEKEKFEIYKRINGYLAQEDYTEFNKMLEEIYGKEKLSELQENVRNRVIENIADKLKVKNERLSQELRIPEAQLNVAKRIMKRYIKENGSVNIENIEKWFKENTGHGTDFAANWIQTKKETIVKLINESIAENKDILSNEKMIFDILKQGKEHFQRPWIRNIIGTENQVEFTREELQRLFGESYISAHENEYKSKLILKPGVSQEEFYKEIERKKYKRCHYL